MVFVSVFPVEIDSSKEAFYIYDRELRAIYISVQYFRLESAGLVVETDHKPLIYAFYQEKNRLFISVSNSHLFFNLQ